LRDQLDLFSEWAFFPFFPPLWFHRGLPGSIDLSGVPSHQFFPSFFLYRAFYVASYPFSPVAFFFHYDPVVRVLLSSSVSSPPPLGEILDKSRWSLNSFATVIMRPPPPLVFSFFSQIRRRGIVFPRDGIFFPPLRGLFPRVPSVFFLIPVL